ncbi:MAG: hypothetical protein ABI778_05695 [Ignavibacteriota bacterium]
MKGLQLLTTISSELEAELLKGKLADAGIACFVQFSWSIAAAAIRDASVFYPGIDIFVEPYDLETATELITTSADDLTDDLEVGEAAKC